TDDRLERADSVRRDARPQHVDAEAAVECGSPRLPVRAPFFKEAGDEIATIDRTGTRGGVLPRMECARRCGLRAGCAQADQDDAHLHGNGWPESFRADRNEADAQWHLHDEGDIR